MGPFEMVVAIVAITVIGGIAREFMKKSQVNNTDIKDILDRLERLEALDDRVQTLEKIVTDKKEDLKQKIDSL